MNIRVIGPRDPRPKDGMVLNVTSSGTTWVNEFSPFFLGPVELYDGMQAKNVENAWQFAKVYADQILPSGDISDDYFDWASAGWADSRAHRYPAGKGAKPEFTLWKGERLGYIEARKLVYAPLYRKAVLDSGYFEALVQFVWDCLRDEQTVYIFDYDGYDHKKLGMSYKDVLNNPNRKMGHGFVLAQMLEEEIDKLEVLNSNECYD